MCIIMILPRRSTTNTLHKSIDSHSNRQNNFKSTQSCIPSFPHSLIPSFPHSLIMKFASYLSLLGATAALAAPLDSRAGVINFVVGQNYIDEWDAFKSALVTPAGISTYGDIWSGALNSDSQTLLSTYAASYRYSS